MLMELFADYFASWLFGLVADKSSRWLVSLVIGDDLDRELRRAARAAVACTVREVLPAGVQDVDSAAGFLIEAIDDSFARRPAGDLTHARHATLLEALDAGIAARILPIGEILHGDGAVRPVGISSLDVAQELSVQLVREIVLRGARGGPLKPLADQLNADVTHLQGEQTLAVLGRLADTVTQALAHLEEANAGPRAMSTLPADAEAFTGRQAEVERLIGTLRQDGLAQGVVTVDAINGMAGVGKTALAVHVAHLLASHFPDGQLYVHLHGHTPGQRPVRPLYALSALLLETGFPPDRIPAGLEECAAVWRGHMAHRKVLLLLDDAASAAQVRPLLPGSAGSLVLVTSRQRLTALPGARAITIDVLSPEHAADLFVRLAGRDGLTAGDPAVAEVARLCGNLPLAISLMAAQLMCHPAWTPADLAADLESAQSRLGLIVAGDISVARAIGLSYRNLKPGQRRLFRQLSLCPAAEVDVYTAAALDAADLKATARRLRELSEYNLLRENSKGRYSLHDLIREYARARAPGDSSRQARAARRRLLDYYLHCARAADRYLHRRTATGIPGAVTHPPSAVPQIENWRDALRWMDAEHVNVHDATRYAALHGWPQHAIAIPAAMNSYLRSTGNWNESRELTSVALRSATAPGGQAARPSLLCDLGDLHYFAGEFDSATDTFTMALELARDLHDQLGEANARLRLSAVQTVRGHADEALASIDLAARICHDLGDLPGQACAAIYRGVTQFHTGRFGEAEQNLSSARDMYRALGIPGGEADALGWLGAVQHETGRLESAEASLTLAADMHHQARDRLQEVGDIYYLGAVQRDAGKFEAATQNLQLALQVYRDSGDLFGEAGVLNQLGRLEAEQAAQTPIPSSGQERARTALARALELYRSFKTKIGEAEVLNTLGRLDLTSGDYRQARTHLDAALARAEESASKPEKARALEGIALCLIESGEHPQAIELLRQAHAIYQEIKSPHAQRAERLLNDLANTEEDPC
ncbi:MAG TPA: tetratricopeptide repeat protein [Streptosporangiaceae bacterium]|nr:tetratricopeptide repeat protein [Streptosporangiaceae bacterium]